jgi:NADPH:quinone reductase-like Zn-dependent oxidoreductase
MKAAVYREYGSPNELTIEEFQKPSPGKNDVLVRVHAASLNDWDWQMLQGIPFVNRLEAGLRRPVKVPILGCDIAGTIEAVGAEAKRFRLGDEVYGDLSSCGFGGFAEYVCAPESALCRKPSNISFQQAAAVPQAGILALQGIRDVGKLKSGQRLLINGAAGGVGTFGIQIAKRIGAEVTGVDHTEKLDLMSSLGFDHVIDYTREDFTLTDQRYDLIIDNKTNRSLSRYLRALNPGGRYVVLGGSGARILQTFLFGPIVRIAARKSSCLLMLKPNAGLDYINELFESDELRSVIDRVYSLDDISEAFRRFGDGKHRGKIVVEVHR